MEQHKLDKWLKSADASFPAPRMDSDLAARVRFRSRVMAVAAGLALTATGASAFWMLRGIPIGTARIAAIAPERELRNVGIASDAREELKRWIAEAKWHAAFAERLCADERAEDRREQIRRDSARPNVIEEFATVRDRAAATLVLYADQRSEIAGGTEEAARTYQTVLTQFPSSSSSLTARERLSKH
jgi:hypothetical protein